MADWLVEGQTQTINCTADPSNIACSLDDIGEGTGGFLSSITPALILLIVGIGIGGAVVALLKKIM